MNDVARVCVENFNAGFGEWPGSEAVSGPGVGDFEGGGGESSLSFITVPDFVAAGPEVAIVSRVAATAGCDGISFNRAL